MAEPENLTLIFLLRLDEKMDRVIDRLAELTKRGGKLERGYANVSSRLDRLAMRMDRVERRLDLVDVAH